MAGNTKQKLKTKIIFIITLTLLSAVSQLPVVRSEHVRTFCDSIQFSKFLTHEFSAAMPFMTHLDNTLFLSSLQSHLCT